MVPEHLQFRALFLATGPQSEILNRQGHPAPALGTRNAKTEMA